MGGGVGCIYQPKLIKPRGQEQGPGQGSMCPASGLGTRGYARDKPAFLSHNRGMLLGTRHSPRPAYPVVFAGLRLLDLAHNAHTLQ